MPLARPVIVHEVEEVVQVAPPGEAVAVYEVIAAPPFEEGALQEIVAWASPAVADAEVGAPGAPVGITAAEAGEAGALQLERRATVSKV